MEHLFWIFVSFISLNSGLANAAGPTPPKYTLSCTCNEGWRIEAERMDTNGSVTDQLLERHVLKGQSTLDLSDYKVGELEQKLQESKLCEKATLQIDQRAAALKEKMVTDMSTRKKGDEKIRSAAEPYIFRTNQTVCDDANVQLQVARTRDGELQTQTFSIRELIARNSSPRPQALSPEEIKMLQTTNIVKLRSNQGAE